MKDSGLSHSGRHKFFKFWFLTTNFFEIFLIFMDFLFLTSLDEMKKISAIDT